MKYPAIAVSILCAFGYQGPSIADPVKIRFAAPYDETEPVGAAARLLASELNAKLEGEIELETRDMDVLTALTKGDIDLAAVPSGLLTKDNPNMVIFDLPFLFLNLEDLILLQSSYVGEAILGSVDKTDLVGLAYWNNGLNRLFSHQYIDDVSHLKELLLWTGAVPSVHPTVMGLGASPVALSREEGLAAITAEAIDAADLPLIRVASQPEEYAFKQVLDVGYHPEVAVLAANEAFWDALPYTAQVEIAGIVRDLQDDIAEITYRAEKEAISILIGSEFEMNFIETEDRNDFRAQASEVWGLSLDKPKRSILNEVRLILAETIVDVPEHKTRNEWRTVPISYVTDRSAPDDGDLTEVFSNAFVIDISYGSIRLKLNTKIPIGADHTGSYELEDLSILDGDQFWQGIEGSLARPGRALIVVHGFNVSFLDAALQAAVLALDLKFGEPVVMFSWPSDGNVYRYAKDEEIVQLAEDHFGEILEGFLSLKEIERLYIVNHSMGARLVAETPAGLVSAGQSGRVSKVELIFGAPDINSQLFGMRMDKIAGLPARVTLYASDNDMALHCAREFHGDYDRAGQEGDAVVIHRNVETVDATALIPESQRAKYKECVPGVVLATIGLAAKDFEHSYLFNDARVIGDLAALVQTDRGAADRFRLEKVETGKGSFHRMRP